MKILTFKELVERICKLSISALLSYAVIAVVVILLFVVIYIRYPLLFVILLLVGVLVVSALIKESACKKDAEKAFLHNAQQGAAELIFDIACHYYKQMGVIQPWNAISIIDVVNPFPTSDGMQLIRLRLEKQTDCSANSKQLKPWLQDKIKSMAQTGRLIGFPNSIINQVPALYVYHLSTNDHEYMYIDLLPVEYKDNMEMLQRQVNRYKAHSQISRRKQPPTTHEFD